jgi:DNA-binding NtrC family response regulator/tetratricopeptide (TPR) repeat protein/class 3 adenylate cyclase
MAQPGSLPRAHPTDRIIGNSPAIQTLRAQIHRLAAFDTVGSAFVPTVLLQGETGSGKGLVARVIHDSGPRAQGPFVDVNCAAIPDTLLEVELFGFEAGAFTDAKRAKPGLLESASRGTLFLDEIDALPLPLQSKLLNAIEEKRVRRLGAVGSRQLDIKLIAATPTDLSVQVTEGRFRLDLYHRLTVLILEIPPLHKRGEDLRQLAQYFLHRYAEAHGLLPKRLSRDAEAWLQGYRWPGNVRELSHLMERVTLLRMEGVVSAPILEELCLPLPHRAARPGETPPRGDAAPPDEPTRIRQTLGQTGGNVVRAARLLGISRAALRYRMRRYRIGRPSWEESTPPHSSRERGAIWPLEAERDQPISMALPALEPAWEQKPVAVLAIDVTWPEAMAPHPPRVELWTVATRWQQIIAEKVWGFGGLIFKQSPSPHTAVFGIPHTLEQLSQRAVQAALTIRHLVAGGSVTGGGEPCPAVRMAVHLGQVLVDVQASDPTARLLPLGETLSLPQRLLGHAAPGDILLSPQVGRLVEGWFELRVREGPAGAGIADGVGAYAVVGVGPRRSPLEVYGKRPLSRFVGRERELAVLGEILAQVEKGHGQVVGIVGEPGVGKSRLCYEWTQMQRIHGWLILESSPVAYGKETPYLPVIELLKAFFQVDARDERRTIRDKVMGKLRTLDETLEPTLPALLALLDVPVEDPHWHALDLRQRRQRTLDALKRLMLRESQVHPLLLIVENLHWIDTETQAFLDSLVESLPTARLLLLVNYRPEYQHRWGSKTSYTQLRLDPLSPESAEAFLVDLLGEDTGLEPLRQHLIVRTQGNPFFLEESVRTLVETQALVGGPGSYRLMRAVPTIQVPATVTAVLAARVDRLTPEDKRLLQTAAVIGTEVPLPLLRAIAELPEDTLHRGLAHLQAAEFLYETLLFPAHEYTFKHALTQEVAYGSLLQERQRELHACIVQALECLTPDHLAAQVERLAHHALRGEVWDKALVYCRQAGEKALARSAYREAVGYFEQALSTLPHLPETRDMREQAIDLRFALRSVLLPSGDLGRILAALREAESLAEALDDPRRLGQVSVFLSTHFYFRGAHDQAIAAGQRALALATAGGDITLRGLTNQYIARSYHAQGDYRRAIDCYKQAVASFEGARRRERFGQVFVPAVQSRAWLAWCYAELGMFAEGHALGEEGLRIAEGVDHPGSLMLAYRGIGLLSLRQGDLGRALPRLERAVSLCHEVALLVYFPLVAAALGAAYTLCGRVTDAVPLLTQAMKQTIPTEMAGFRALCHLPLGKAQLLAGRLGEADALATSALAIAREHQEHGHEAYARRLLGEIAARRHPLEFEEAEFHYREALALAHELGMCPLQAHCHFSLGTLCAKTDRPKQARAELTAAIDLYRAMDMAFWLPQAEAALAQGL